MPYILERREPPRGGWAGWYGPVVATALAAALRLPRLGEPHAMVFDETYYAKDALSLLRYGYERKSVQGADELLLSGQSGIFTTEAEYVVHPPFGKWVIAFGEHLFGANPFGWRIAIAILGVASVLVTARVARRLARSNTVGTVAGLLLALDGLHITMSRTALLDMTLSFLVLIAFALSIMDRDRPLTAGIRWTRPAMAVVLGLAMATKWSGLYFAVVFGVLMLYWDITKRRHAASANATATWVRKDLLPALLMPLAALSAYLVTWVGWFRSTDAWDRQWKVPGESAETWLTPLRRLAHYHSEMLSFHTHLTAAHSYRANPWGWPLMIRPTSFYYETPDTCGAESCSQEVIPLGNPLIWWVGAFAVLVLVFMAIRRFHSAALPIVAAFAAGWVPWLFFAHRTTFTFYSVVYVPYTVMALALVAYLVTSRSRVGSDEWNWSLIAAVAVVAVVTMFFYPVLTGITLPYDQWRLRMWLPSWI